MEDYGGYTFAFHRRKRVYGDMEKICKYDDEAAKCILAKGKFSYTYNLVFDYERWWISSVDYSTELIMAWQSILNESAEASQQLRLLQEEAQRKKEMLSEAEFEEYIADVYKRSADLTEKWNVWRITNSNHNVD